jgi:hypothetical protein
MKFYENTFFLMDPGNMNPIRRHSNPKSTAVNSTYPNYGATVNIIVDDVLKLLI